jgi:hypothetical protein
MKICKNLNPIEEIVSLKEWEIKCPPQKQEHWKDGRSAKETAKHWLYIIPKEFRELLKCFHFEYELCSPEFVTKFDKYTGNGRNHDLLITAKDQKNETVVISIESKVDEPFDKTIGDYLKEIKRKKEKGENTNADKRMEDLKKAIFPKVEQEIFETLKYQLLTAVAGTLAEAKTQKAKRAIFLIQTFVSSNIDSKKHRQNQRDLDYFMEIISNGKHTIIHDNDLFGTFKFRGNEYIPRDVELWMGKYSIGI